MDTVRPKPATAAVLLAAGAGTRLRLGPKALLEDDAGIPLVRRIASVLLAAGCSPVCVVLGAGADAVRASVDLSDCMVVTHPEWAKGMGGSFRQGIQAVPDGVPVLVALVDQPGVDVALVRRLLRVHAGGAASNSAAHHGAATRAVLAKCVPADGAATGGAAESCTLCPAHAADIPTYRSIGTITAAAYRDAAGTLRRGHPVVFAADVAATAAEQAHGDRGARGFLAAHPELVDLVDCSDLSDGGDVDVPVDLFRLRR